MAPVSVAITSAPVETMPWHRARLIKGHGVASGQAQDSPYPQGSISMQMPVFKQLGLDLSHCWPGTLNLSLAPLEVHLQQADYCFEKVRWTELHPPETFSFWNIQLRDQQRPSECISSWIYQPHPETKERHLQPASMVEVLAPRIESVKVGMVLEIRLPPGRLQLLDSASAEG